MQGSSWIWLSRHYAAGLCLRFVLFLCITVALFFSFIVLGVCIHVFLLG